MSRSIATVLTMMFMCFGQQLWAEILRYPPSSVADPTMDAVQLALLEQRLSEENGNVSVVEDLLRASERPVTPAWHSIISGDTEVMADTPATPAWLVFLLVLSLLAAVKAVQALAVRQRLTLAYARLYWNVFDPLQF